MNLITRLGLTFLALFQSVSTLPLRRDGITALSATEIDSYKIYADFARIGYCPPSKTANWTCGDACNAIPDFTPYAAGGDGGDVPYWYVGYHAGSHSVVVGNQGTDFDKFEAALVDVEFFQKNLNATLFPGVSEGVKAHSGFIDAQAMSAAGKLAAVQLAMASSGTNSVVLTGHSLGGAISLLDSLYLALNLPSITIKTVTHGMPRVGNSEFADLIDIKTPDLSRITNMQDLVPIMPGRLFGFAHPNGEKHIVDAGSWVACAGHDNTDKSCSTGAVPTIFNGRSKDHGVEPPRVLNEFAYHPSQATALSHHPPPRVKYSPKPIPYRTCSLIGFFSMQQATSYIKQAFLYPGAMIATPIVAALMLVAIGGGILDDAIVGVPDSLTRWWKGTLTQKKRVQVFSSEENTSRSSRRTRKPSILETAFEQLEMHARKQRRKRLAEQAAASLSVKPMDKQSTRMSPPVSSPRVIGTRRRRSRGGSYDMEMQNL
ncbi:unnamed protein product [Rhizoctonia solani]|uniref:Fungal lipase-type domain-containing protein n=1 Tax=Rhizoctonia solani TaxID=456999 RepID=A0A8H2Y3B2_9AGAM|nr:unnamed protein product [Rhizoctonia solani]